MCQICTLALRYSKLGKQDLQQLNSTSLSDLIILNPPQETDKFPVPNNLPSPTTRF